MGNIASAAGKKQLFADLFLNMRNLFLTVAFFLGLGALTAQAQFSFTTNNGAITITSYTGAGGNVVIPAAINGPTPSQVSDMALFKVPA